jgi:hypothetical protein
MCQLNSFGAMKTQVFCSVRTTQGNGIDVVVLQTILGVAAASIGPNERTLSAVAHPYVALDGGWNAFAMALF